MEFTIYRADWCRVFGDGTSRGDESKLLTPDGQLCCLGFYLAACGVPLRKLLNRGLPQEVARAAIPKAARWLDPRSSSTGTGYTNDLAGANDNADPLRNYSPEEQECRIQELFAEQGIRVNFSDAPNPRAAEILAVIKGAR